MSVSAYAAGALATPDTTAYGLLVGNSTTIRSRLDTLTEQASTGLIATVFSGLGAGAAATLDLRAELTAGKAQTDAIAGADGRITLTQTVLGQIGSIAATFYSQAATLNALNPSNVDVVAASARASLQQLAGLLNTQDGGDYLFAGSDAAQAPIPDAAGILASPLVTGIAAAVGGLAANGAAATAATTLSLAASNAAGTTPFSAALSAGTAATATLATGNGAPEHIGILANANATAVSAGTATTGSYVRDLIRSLATLGSLTSTQVNTAGFDALVADTRTSLNGAVAAVADEQGILGNTKTRIDATGTLITATGTALKSQVSNIEDVDLAAVSTQLTQTQANLQASYKLIASIADTSLLKYL